MTLHATARQANVLDSLKRYFVDTIETGKGIPITFDKGLAYPDIQNTTVDKWVSINMGTTDFSLLSNIYVIIYCCTRKDNEGFKLAQVCDHVYEALSVDTSTAEDNFKRIPFYQSAPLLANWVSLGSLLVQEIMISDNLIAPDETKYKMMTVRLRVPSMV